jgi:RNA polymerase primary sigma factor
MAKDFPRPSAGPASDPSLKRYLEDIRKAPQLRAQDESELFRLYRKGSRAARERLIISNMRFVVKVALEYRACPMPMSDLISEGSLGLIHSVETFDPARGVKFISYAVWWIRSHITKALNEKGYLIRLPANQYFRLRKALQAERHGRIEEEDLRIIRQLSQGCASLHAPQPGTGRSWSDALPDPRSPDPGILAEVAVGQGITERMLENMPERERHILKRTYGIGDENPITLKEVGRDLSLSAERARQLRSQALRRMQSEPAYAPLKERYACLAEARPD